jgi:hypothetical protein
MAWVTKRRIAITTIAIVALVLAPLLSGYLWLKASYLRGRLAAKRDVRKGQYLELGYGLPVPWRKDGARLVHDRFPEAQFVPVAGCVVSSSLQQYVRGYNDYAQQASMKHFGHDVFAESFDEAYRTFQQQPVLKD